MITHCPHRDQNCRAPPSARRAPTRDTADCRHGLASSKPCKRFAVKAYTVCNALIRDETVRSYSAPESEEGLKRSEVPQCLDSGKEKISTVPERCEGWQACYLFADRPLRHAEIEGAILVADEWVSFVAQFVKIRIIDPDILCERRRGL
jgi:hypothetical protein